MGDTAEPRALHRVPARTRVLLTLSIARTQYLVPFALLILFGWLLLTGFTTVERILSYYTPLPYWDYWRIPENLSRYETFDLRAFWRQHNDHRIVFPELVFAFDMLVLHGRLILPLAVSFLSYVATWLVLSSTLFADRLLSRSVALAAALLAGVIALWQGSAALLAAPFQLQWTLMQLAVACSLVSLSTLKESSRPFYLIATIAAAVVANYSSGNGLLLWPLLCGLGVLVRLKRRHLLALGLASVVFIALYFVGYQFGSELNLRSLLLHPVYLLGYFGSYLSMPFGGMKSPGFGVWVGLVNLALTLLLLIAAARRGLLFSKPGLVLFGSYSFTLLTILLTAAGRMDPSDPTFTNAKPARYVTVPLMNWAVFILLCFWVSARARLRVVSPRAIALLIGVLLLLYLPKLRDWLALVTEDYSEQQLGTLSLQNDLVDPNLIRKIFVSVEFVVNLLPELREQHLSIYFKPRDRWLGKPALQFARRVDSFIPGRLTHTYPVRGGVEVLGWADGSSLRRSYRWILLANERGEIVGFGERLPAGFPSKLRADDVPPSLAWVGFVNLTWPSQQISAYVIDARRGGLFPIAGSISVPAVQPATLEDAAGSLAGVTWQKDPIWSENRLPTLVPFGQVPPGPIWGSWSGNDANRGQLVSSPFAAPANSCVILPILHGPKSGGLSVDLADADTGQTLATAPMQDEATRWEYWRVPIPTAVHHLRITARDEGKDWGEWVATANPLACR